MRCYNATESLAFYRLEAAMRTMIAGAIVVLAGAVIWGAATIAKMEKPEFIPGTVVYSVIGWIMIIVGAISDRRRPPP
jgi:hypothetical protein